MNIQILLGQITMLELSKLLLSAKRESAERNYNLLNSAEIISRNNKSKYFPFKDAVNLNNLKTKQFYFQTQLNFFYLPYLQQTQQILIWQQNIMISGFLKAIKNTLKPKPQSQAKDYIVEIIKTSSGKIIQKKYVKHRLLGSGTFAQCYLTENLDTKKLYATKIISKSCSNRAKHLNEIVIHQQLHHENVVDFSHAFQDENDIYIFMELCVNGSLQDLLQKKYILSTSEIQKLIFQIIQGVIYIHSKNFIHCDLKPRNIFLAEGNIVKIGDFGQTCKMESETDKKTILCGTPQYMAPQLIGGKSYGKEVDIWAIGILIYQMYTGKTPFLDQSNQLIKNNILNLEYVYTQKGIPKEALLLVKKMLIRNPQLRPTLNQILQSSFFKKFQAEKISMLYPKKCNSFNLNFEQSSICKQINHSKLQYTIIPQQKILKKKCPYITQIVQVGTEIILYAMSNGSLGLYAKNIQIIHVGHKQVNIKLKKCENENKQTSKEQTAKLKAILNNYQMKKQQTGSHQSKFTKLQKYKQEVFLIKFSKHRNILICRLSNNYIQLRFEDKTSLVTNLGDTQEATLYINEYNIISELAYEQLFQSQNQNKGVEQEKIQYAKRIYKSLGMTSLKKKK